MLLFCKSENASLPVYTIAYFGNGSRFKFSFYMGFHWFLAISILSKMQPAIIVLHYHLHNTQKVEIFCMKSIYVSEGRSRDLSM